LNFGSRARSRRGRRRTFLRRPHLLRRRLRALAPAPHRSDEFSVDAIGETFFRQVIPEETSARIVDVGDSLLERKFFGHAAAGIIGTLFAAIADRPSLLVVVGGSGSGRPEVAVAGNLSAVVEIIEHSELQRELVLVRRDVSAVHGERWVAVASGQVAKDLIVGAIFFQHIDHVTDRIASTSEFELAAIGANEIVFLNLARIGGKILVDVIEAEALDGAADQSRNVGVFLPFALTFQLAQHVVGPAAFSFGSGDKQVVARDGERARIPLGGNETGFFNIHYATRDHAWDRSGEIFDF